MNSRSCAFLLVFTLVVTALTVARRPPKVRSEMLRIDRVALATHERPQRPRAARRPLSIGLQPWAHSGRAFPAPRIGS